MPTNSAQKIRTKNKNLFLRVTKGHFATGHSHTNYYIDVTSQKIRLSEAKAVAEALVAYYSLNTVVDTILCLDGTEVIGTCIAEALTRNDFINLNAHQTIYVVTPEHTSGSQLLFRDNLVPAIANKHVLVLAASVTIRAIPRFQPLRQFVITAVMLSAFRQYLQLLKNAAA